MGEHQEWSKYSNFEVSVKVPLIVHIPGLTEKERKPFKRTDVLSLIGKNETLESAPKYISEELVELVDLFPTLAKIADLPVPPLCRLYATQLCSEGISFDKVIKHHVSGEVDDDFSWKTGVFSQYPRPSVAIQPNSDQPKLEDIKFMGYSIRTARYRYTEWISFNSTICKPVWQHVVAKELYDHKYDRFETNNLSNDTYYYSNIVKELSKKVQSGWRHCLPPDMFDSI